MKKHRFRFSKESKESLEHFGAAVPEQPAQADVIEEVPVPDSETDEPAEAAAAPSFVIEARTDIGKVRQSNQDAIILDGRLCGVADGMGGHQGGERASAGARDCLIELLKGKEPEPNELHQAIRAANRRLFLEAAQVESLAGMGTTLTALWFGNESVYIGHVGDSRCYLLREGELRQVTDDHSLVAEMMRAGLLTAEQAATHHMRNVITRAVGTESGVTVDMLAVARKKGDKWLVCSDGLHGLVSDEAIKAILAEHEPAEAAGLLIDAALDAGGRDNVTVVVVSDREGV